MFVYVLRDALKDLTANVPMPKSNQSFARIPGVLNAWPTEEVAEEADTDSLSPMYRGNDSVPFKRLKIQSKTRTARGHCSVSPKLKRVRRSLDDVTSTVLGKIRRMKISNMWLLIVGETFATKASFSSCSRSIDLI